MSGVNRDQHEPWATRDRVFEELRYFHERGCRAVGFLGGEPTVYPHIIESVGFARELGYTRISICSNGTRLRDAVFCRRLVEAGLTRATLSVHSRHPEIEDRLATRVPGNLARKIAGLRNLIALRGEGYLRDGVSLNPVLFRRNLSDVEEYVSYFGGLGVDDIRFNYIWPEGDVHSDPAWVPSLREAMPSIVRLMLINERKLKKRLTFGGVPKCALRLAGVSGRLLSYLAAKYLDECGFDPANDVSIATREAEDCDRFVWQEVKRDRLKVQAASCGDCTERRRCEGVWRSYAQLYGLAELQPL